MPYYEYNARNKEGGLITGGMEAENIADLQTKIQNENYILEGYLETDPPGQWDSWLLGCMKLERWAVRDASMIPVNK